MCPVHTPDGAPCGLLNHLAAMCEVDNLSLSSFTKTFFITDTETVSLIYRQ